MTACAAMRRLLLLVVAGVVSGVLLGAFACSGTDPSTATVDGTVGGITLQAHDAIFAALVLEDGLHHDAVLISDYPNACTQSRDNASVPNGTRLILALTQRAPTGAVEPATPGDFLIGAPAGAQRVAEAELQKDDASCAATLDAAAGQALSGTVTVSASDTEFIDGTFDLLMPAGEHLTGQFHAAICAEPTHKPLPTCRVE